MLDHMRKFFQTVILLGVFTVVGAALYVYLTDKHVIVFKDGNLANGKVLTNTFPIKTSYGEIVVKKKDIANIHMRGIQFKTDQIVTLDLNRFRGSLQLSTIRIKLMDGQNIEVIKNKINTIVMLTNYQSA